jgi:hypothetical protein
MNLISRIKSSKIVPFILNKRKELKEDYESIYGYPIEEGFVKSYPHEEDETLSDNERRTKAEIIRRYYTETEKYTMLVIACGQTIPEADYKRRILSLFYFEE